MSFYELFFQIQEIGFYMNEMYENRTYTSFTYELYFIAIQFLQTSESLF